MKGDGENSVLKEYKCPCCSGFVNFDVSSQNLKCPYCDTEFDIETLKQYDDALSGEDENLSWETSENKFDDTTDLCVFVCNSCSGEILVSEHAAALSCPYCGNAVVIKSRISGELMPDIIIPFKYDKKAAKEALKNHFKGKVLLPEVFKDENHIDEIKGIYVPFWLYDSDVDADIRYRATRVRFWSDSNYNYTKTSHYLVTRGGEIGFANVPVDASLKLDNELMESVEPYNFAEAKEFNSAYLAGFLADKYSVSSEENATRANERIKKSTEEAFRRTVVGYNTVITEKSSVRQSGGRSRYALLPIWLLNTTWRDEKYVFAMNAQTGRLVGDLPLDVKALLAWFFSLTVGVGALTMLITYLVWLFG